MKYRLTLSSIKLNAFFKVLSFRRSFSATCFTSYTKREKNKSINIYVQSEESTGKVRAMETIT